MKIFLLRVAAALSCLLACSCASLLESAIDSALTPDVDNYNRAGERKSDSRISAEREERFMYSIGD